MYYKCCLSSQANLNISLQHLTTVISNTAYDEMSSYALYFFLRTRHTIFLQTFQIHRYIYSTVQKS